jgi:hypothetical protein
MPKKKVIKKQRKDVVRRTKGTYHTAEPVIPNRPDFKLISLEVGKGDNVANKVILDTGRLDGKLESYPLIESSLDAERVKEKVRKDIQGTGITKAQIRKLGL